MGGYLPLELDIRSEYFDEFAEEDIVRLDCGRSAFWYALQDSKPSKVYTPYLNCAYSTDPMDQLGIPYEYYELDDDLTPKNLSLKPDEAIIWVNYYGNATEKAKDKIKKYVSEGILICDNCHAFYSKPLKGAYNCYSMRKFFGVCDGAYLIKKGIDKIEIPPSYSSSHIGFILECIEKGTNACYSENLKNEDRLGRVCKSMSLLTRLILSSIDYSVIQERRYDNFKIIHKHLKDINEFEVNIDSRTHMYYPLLITNDGIRERLVDRKIYTPTWWRHVPDYFKDRDTIEKHLAKYMLMIPIDQRYDEEDMVTISDIIHEEVSQCQ